MKTCTIPVGQTSIFGQKAWYDRPNILNVVRGNLFSYPVLCDSELYFKLITFGRSVTQNGARQIKVTNRIVFFNLFPLLFFRAETILCYSVRSISRCLGYRPIFTIGYNMFVFSTDGPI